MPSTGEPEIPSAKPSVFLSYASEDRAAASAIRDALAASGLEVWYDENELAGGDAWDKKIRRQIRECDFFMAVISARTDARREGYFRREWRLAVERTLDMDDDHTFLLPVVIDATDQSTAKVPERFLTVQWLKVPNGRATPGLSALCARLLGRGSPENPAPRRPPPLIGAARSAPARSLMPDFPTEEPGQRVKFWVHVVMWSARSAWIGFKRLPRWIRALVCIWLIILLSRGCSRENSTASGMSPEAARKLAAIAGKYQGSTKKEDIAKLGVDIAREFADADDENSSEGSALLAVPFTAASGDAAGEKLADTTFALLYGRVSIAHRGEVGLSKDPLASPDASSAAERGRASRTKYVLFGGVQNRNGSQALNVYIVRVSDGSVVWNKSYPADKADPSAIVPEIEAAVPALEKK